MDDTFPDDDNGEVLRNMAKSGDDLSVQRDIDFSVIFTRETDATEFCKKLVGPGVRTTCFRREDVNELWDVTVTVTMLPSHPEISSFENHLSKIAAPLGGENDGWGCFAITAK